MVRINLEVLKVLKQRTNLCGIPGLENFEDFYNSNQVNHAVVFTFG